jgi:hypothetical protein
MQRLPIATAPLTLRASAEPLASRRSDSLAPRASEPRALRASHALALCEPESLPPRTSAPAALRRPSPLASSCAAIPETARPSGPPPRAPLFARLTPTAACCLAESSIASATTTSAACANTAQSRSRRTRARTTPSARIEIVASNSSATRRMRTAAFSGSAACPTDVRNNSATFARLTSLVGHSSGRSHTIFGSAAADSGCNTNASTTPHQPRPRTPRSIRASPHFARGFRHPSELGSNRHTKR